VAEVRVNLADLSQVERLPTVCVRCGRAATSRRSIRLTTTESNRPSSWGWLLWEFGFWTSKEKDTFEYLLHEYKISRGRIKLPVCWLHRWIVPPFIGVRVVNERRVELRRVSDEFVSAIRKKGWGR